MQMTCNSRCTTASGRTCVCPCGGAGHGVGRLEWVRVTVKINEYIANAQKMNDPGPDGADKALRNTVKGAFASAPKHSKVVSPAPSAIAGFKQQFGPAVTDAEIETYCQSLWRKLLAENNLNTRINVTNFKRTVHTIAQLERLAEYLRSVEIVDQLVDSTANQVNYSDLIKTVQILETAMQKPSNQKSYPPAVKARLEDHFFCDLFAALAQALGTLQTLPNKWKKLLVQQICQTIDDSRSKSYGCSIGSRKSNIPSTTRKQEDQTGGLTGSVINAIVTQVVNKVFPTAPAQAVLSQYQRLFQMLAVLLCPSPQQHKLVWDECVVPIIKSLIQHLGTTSLLGTPFDVPDKDIWDQLGSQTKKASSQSVVSVP